MLPNPPLTYDQVVLMKRDNVVSPGASTFADLGINPTAVETQLPLYVCPSSREIRPCPPYLTALVARSR